VSFTRPQSSFRCPPERSCCNNPHRGALITHRRFHNDEPRPLIVRKLRELVTASGRRLDYATCERFAGECGAGELEIEALLLDSAE
jgi:hypothetical protein